MFSASTAHSIRHLATAHGRGITVQTGAGPSSTRMIRSSWTSQSPAPSARTTASRPSQRPPGAPWRHTSSPTSTRKAT